MLYVFDTKQLKALVKSTQWGHGEQYSTARQTVSGMTHNCWAIVSAVVFTNLSVSALFSPEGQLVNKLLQNYTKAVRPVLNPLDRIKVNISLVMISLFGVDEKKQFIQLSYYLRLSWKDKYLKWSKWDHDGM